MKSPIVTAMITANAAPAPAPTVPPTAVPADVAAADEDAWEDDMAGEPYDGDVSAELKGESDCLLLSSSFLISLLSFSSRFLLLFVSVPL